MMFRDLFEEAFQDVKNTFRQQKNEVMSKVREETDDLVRVVKGRRPRLGKKSSGSRSNNYARRNRDFNDFDGF